MRKQLLAELNFLRPAMQSPSPSGGPGFGAHVVRLFDAYHQDDRLLSPPPSHTSLSPLSLEGRGTRKESRWTADGS